MYYQSLGAILALVSQLSGTPYIPGGISPAGTDCSGLASIVANAASGRDPFSSRFTTANEGSALVARGFAPGSAPGAVVIGWNGGHTAVTLPDGTNVSSGEGGGVRFGGGGAHQAQFVNQMHIYLPESAPAPAVEPAADMVMEPAVEPALVQEPADQAVPEPVQAAMPEEPVDQAVPEPVDQAAPEPAIEPAAFDVVEPVPDAVIEPEVPLG